MRPEEYLMRDLARPRMTRANTAPPLTMSDLLKPAPYKPTGDWNTVEK